MEQLEKKYGYHLTDIPKGVIGESSKLLEEIHELIDAEKQHAKVMSILELCDLIGSVELYLEKHVPGISLDDLRTMASITKRVFQNGHRI